MLYPSIRTTTTSKHHFNFHRCNVSYTQISLYFNIVYILQFPLSCLSRLSSGTYKMVSRLLGNYASLRRRVRVLDVRYTSWRRNRPARDGRYHLTHEFIIINCGDLRQFAGATDWNQFIQTDRLRTDLSFKRCLDRIRV